MLYHGVHLILCDELAVCHVYNDGRPAVLQFFVKSLPHFLLVSQTHCIDPFSQIEILRKGC